MAANKDKLETIAFEDALEQLETVVTSMEAGDIPLGALVDHYEKGSHYLRICQTRLKEAELKIEKLKQEHNQWETEPFALGDPATDS